MGICTQQLLSDVTLPEHSGDELQALVSKADLAAIDSIASAYEAICSAENRRRGSAGSKLSTAVEALVSKADLVAIDSIASASAGAEPRTKRLAAQKTDEVVQQARSSAVP